VRVPVPHGTQSVGVVVPHGRQSVRVPVPHGTQSVGVVVPHGRQSVRVVRVGHLGPNSVGHLLGTSVGHLMGTSVGGNMRSVQAAALGRGSSRSAIRPVRNCASTVCGGVWYSSSISFRTQTSVPCSSGSSRLKRISFTGSSTQ
jgi:hypothetical protein